MVLSRIGQLHEQNANVVIAQWLNASGRHWTVSGDRTAVLVGSSRRPDIVIRQAGRMPVIVECEYGHPAVADARSRLGAQLVNAAQPFTEVIAAGIATVCQNDDEQTLRQRLDNNEAIFTIQLVSGKDPDNYSVWPKARPLTATPADLAAYCEYAQVPQSLIQEESDRIADLIRSAGGLLLERIRMTRQSDEILGELRALTGTGHKPDEQNPQKPCPTKCDHNEQAANTACAIWLIAIDLQNDLARYSSALRDYDLKAADGLKAAAPSRKLTAEALLEQWAAIAEVNYLPVIEIAIDSLKIAKIGEAISDVLESLNGLCAHLNNLHAKHIYNFAGELWQRLVSDRKGIAAFYTKPEIAELLATLAAARFNDRNRADIAALNLMDAACGTGTLVGAGERALRRQYAVKGGRDNAALHKNRMENHIYAMDVNGIAGTLTAKRLTDMNVEQDYTQSKIVVITDPAGSLTLLDPTKTGISRVLGYRNVTPTAGLSGEEGIIHVMLKGIDWVLMNPPYSRPGRGRKLTTTGLKEPRARAQKDAYRMSDVQAGLASDFGDLSNIRLKERGVFSHVLPLTAATSVSWRPWRAELEKDFQNIVVIANAATEELQSMSKDTGMSELLVVATKRGERPKKWLPAEILCVNLYAAPTTLAEGYALAQEIAAIPAGADQGLLTSGNYTRIQQSRAGFPWSAVGNSSGEISSVTTALLEGKAYDPLTLDTYALTVPMAKLGSIVSPGPTHHGIGYPKGSEVRGAFEWTPLQGSRVNPAQQAMWAADGETQTSIAAQPTHGGRVVDAGKAREMVGQRSRFHLNRNISWTSQALAVAYTPQLAHGGSAWNALQGGDAAANKAATLFLNSIFGCLVINAYAKSGQRGPRARLQIKTIPGLPCPAFNMDTPAAQAACAVADKHFAELIELELEPLAHCSRDANRHRIDNVVAEMLGLNPQDTGIQEMLDKYRALFAAEPNIKGRRRVALVDQ